MNSSRKTKLAHRVSAGFLALLLVILVVVGAFSSHTLTVSVRRTLEHNLRGQAELAGKLTDELADKALQVATIIAQLEQVRAAYRDPDVTEGRRLLEAFVNPLTVAISDASEIDDYRLHFHRPPAVSFLRTWTAQAGDDLSGFRDTILHVERTQQPLKAIELGRGGFVIRGIAPVMDNGVYLGSVESYYQPTAIVPFLDSSLPTGVVLLVNASAAEELFFGEDYERAFLGRVGDSLVSAVTNEWIDPATIIDVDALDEARTTRQTVIRPSGEYELAYIPLIDFSGEINGHVVVVVDVGPLRSEANRLLQVMLLVVAALMIVGVVFTTTFTNGIIARPLTATAERLNQIAHGDGNLTLRLPENRSDEIGAVARHFNSFTQKLAATVSGIKSATTAMRSNAQDLDASTEDATMSVRSINGLLERVSDQIVNQNASIGESSSSVEQITGNIASLEQVIQRLAGNIDDSSAAVEQMAANISSITRNLDNVDTHVNRLVEASDHGRDTLAQVTTRINEVFQQSEQLQQANQLIATVSAQTNLLAMNAAIEAAHAGEYGRGFAVVAEEIRKLAENSARQSKIIAGELKKSRDYVTNAVNASNEAGKAFTTVRKIVDTVNELETSVHGALREQEAAGQSLMQNLHAMRDLGSEVNQGIGEISDGSRNVLGEMSSLVEISTQVTALSNEISMGSATIGRAIENIRDLSARNRDAVHLVQETADRFRV